MTLRQIADIGIDGRGRITRRRFVEGLLACGLVTSALNWLDLVLLHAEELRRRRKACILLWMQGGPSQLETFDPKPEHPNGGPTRAIETAVSGIRIAEHWPLVAREFRDLAVIRSITNREGNHQRATYQLHTGYTPSGSAKYPSLGSIAAAEIGDPQCDLPHYVAIGARGPEPGLNAGLLGSAYDPFIVTRPGSLPENVAPPVDRARYEQRLALLERIEDEFARAGGGRLVRDHRSLYSRAARLVLSPRLDAFDLSREKESVREAYGSSAFGQGCLLARRLVEAGVTFVEVRSGGWDTHQNNFERVPALAAQVDRGFAALVRDLRERGLLESTLIIWMGEFGRTPRINARAGRDHFPRAFNVVLGGAGIRGGRAVGETSADGMEVRERPVTVPDLFVTICRALGIDPRKENTTPLGRPVKIVDGGEAVEELFG